MNNNNIFSIEALQNYVDGVQKKINDYWKHMNFTFGAPPLVYTEDGRRYVRIVCADDNGKGGKRVHSFIDKTTGNVLKANSWKSACVKNPRSNINDADHGMSGVTAISVVYLK